MVYLLEILFAIRESLPAASSNGNPLDPSFALNYDSTIVSGSIDLGTTSLAPDDSATKK